MNWQDVGRDSCFDFLLLNFSDRISKKEILLEFLKPNSESYWYTRRDSQYTRKWKMN